MNKKALFDLSYGVYIVTSKDGTRDVGCVANSAMQVTSSPATVAVSINHDNFTNGAIKESGRFAVSIMPETASPSLIGTFGFKSSRDTDKFEGLPTLEKDGLHIIPTAKSYLVCRVIDTLETSTHTVFLGEVEDADVLTDGEVMTYAYYHKVIKGKAPKNAPTYVEETKEDASPKWKCGICGYVSDLSELPDDFTCPMCGVPKSLFEKA